MPLSHRRFPAPPRFWHWAFTTSALYAILWMALLCLLSLLLPGGYGTPAEYAGEPGVWLTAGIVGLCQLALLMLPVRVAQGRPASRGSIWLPVLVSGLLFALLMMLACAAVCVAVFEEKPASPEPPWATNLAGIVMILVVPLSWIVWSVVFIRMSKRKDSAGLLDRICRGLFAGSILELLVAVPCHVVVRQRENCCADGITFLGLVTGLSVMLFSFGPAVFFLFIARARELRPPEV